MARATSQAGIRTRPTIRPKGLALSKGIQPVQDIIAHALAIEAEEAQQAGTLGYMARAMVQATMPHKKVTEAVHERTNGFYTFTMLAGPKVGLPYGSFLNDFAGFESSFY